MLALVDVVLAIDGVTAEQEGGDQVKVEFGIGRTVELIVQDEADVFTAAAVVAAQLEAVVRMLKSVIAEPVRPTYDVRLLTPGAGP